MSMYNEGSMVTLANAKEYFDGSDTLKLGKGVCGLVVQVRKGTKEPLYVVDFGAYGRWNCLHNELEGDDPSGWDDNEEDILLTPSAFSPNSNIAAVRSVEEALGLPANPNRFGQWIINIDVETPEVYNGDSEVPIVDLEADIKKRVKELEREIK